MPGPLDGIRVVDVTTMVLGPLASQTLGDLGADVIKVEPPKGDPTRYAGPGRTPGMAAYFLAVNRNKRSLVLDLKQPSGHAALLRLLRTADVFLHNLRPQPAARLGLPYERVRAENPAIVYCATYGFRASGPYGEKPAYDDVIQAASGLVALQSAIIGEPRFVPTILADKLGATAVVQAILAALVHRGRTGEGQAIEVPMFETMAAWVMVEHLYGATFVPPIGGPGITRMLTASRRPLRTRDGHLALLPYTDAHWQAFLAIAGRPDLADDPRFATFSARIDHMDQLFEEMATILPARTTAEWATALDAASVPAMPVNTLDALLADPHLEAIGFWRTVEHPSEGTLLMPDIATTFGGTPGTIRRLQPALGEHSVEVLREAGLTAADIDRMLAAGTTAAP